MLVVNLVSEIAERQLHKPTVLFLWACNPHIPANRYAIPQELQGRDRDSFGSSVRTRG